MSVPCSSVVADVIGFLHCYLGVLLGWKGIGVSEVVGGWLVGWFGVIGGISYAVVVLSFCSHVVVVDLRFLDIHSLFFCSCIIGFSSLLSGIFVRGKGVGWV